ncbi:MAG: hypothetical protein HYW03_01875 [Deltaproteobacteria bacterium]|nr:hypothetical protein [Deltaproteobacteria bacterium]
MAEGAEFPSPGSGRLVCGVFYMRLGGPVACFTIDVLMKPFAFLCHLVDVAGAANRRPSEGNVFCEFSFDRGTMMKLRVDQRGGENDISYRDNRRDDNPDDNGESLYLLRNLFQRSPPYAGLRAGPDSTFTNLTFGPFGQWIFPRRRHGGPSLAQQLGSNNGTRESRLEKSSPLFAFAASP